MGRTPKRIPRDGRNQERAEYSAPYSHSALQRWQLLFRRRESTYLAFQICFCRCQDEKAPATAPQLYVKSPQVMCFRFTGRVLYLKLNLDPRFDRSGPRTLSRCACFVFGRSRQRLAQARRPMRSRRQAKRRLMQIALYRVGRPAPGFPGV